MVIKIPHPTFEEEKKLWEKGFYVIGVDEVGRGAFAGPVVTGAVVFGSDILQQELPGMFKEIHDSKLLKPQKRREISQCIKKTSYCSFVSETSVSIINKIGIGKATFVSFRNVITQVQKFINKPLFVLVDGFHIQYLKGIGLKNQKAIVKGDQKSISIASASIIAKVYRDHLMEQLDTKFPQYQFGLHKGYGTKIHQQAIKKYGLSKIHRTSFNLEQFLH